MLSASVLAVPLLSMVSCFCPRQWEFEGQLQLQTIRLFAFPSLPLEEEKQGRERDSQGCWGMEREG